jgi:hypothetical protein
MAMLVVASAAFLALAGAFFTAEVWLPYARIRDYLVASSNLAGAAVFTESYYAGAMVRAKYAGAFCVASALVMAGAWVWLWRRAGVAAVGRLNPCGKRQLAIKELKWTRFDRTAWIVLVLSIALRLPYLFQPGSSDEVRGYYAWTARPFVLAISDYRAPQHLLYTLLDYPVVRLLGNAEWAIRLPAFLAGICLPMLMLGIGRKWFGRTAGFWGAVLLATTPSSFITASTDGHTRCMLAWCCCFGWLPHRWRSVRAGAGKQRSCCPASWAWWRCLRWSIRWLVICLALAGILAAAARARGDLGQDVGRLALCGAATVWLALLAYLPAYAESDRWNSVDGDDVSGVVPWGRLPARLGWFLVGAFRIWNEDLPVPIVILFLIFSVIGAIATWRQRSLHLLGFNLLAILGLSIVFRIVPYVRVALYFGMAYFLVVAAAWRACGNIISGGAGGYLTGSVPPLSGRGR